MHVKVERLRHRLHYDYNCRCNLYLVTHLIVNTLFFVSLSRGQTRTVLCVGSWNHCAGSKNKIKVVHNNQNDRFSRFSDDYYQIFIYTFFEGDTFLRVSLTMTSLIFYLNEATMNFCRVDF